MSISVRYSQGKPLRSLSVAPRCAEHCRRSRGEGSLVEPPLLLLAGGRTATHQGWFEEHERVLEWGERVGEKSYTY